jgi:DNA-binding NtrC family response regulator/lipopolysaccharide biosynthesis regulator YciM
MKSAQDRQEWSKEKRYGEMALKKLTILSYSLLEEYLLYCYLAKGYTNLANHSQSLNLLYKADRLATKYYFKPPYHAYIAFMMGTNLLWMKNLDQAITNLQKVVQYYQKYGTDMAPMDKKSYFLTMVRLGYCYLHKNNLPQVREIVERTLALALPFEFNDILERYYHLKGEYQIALKEYSQARQSFHKSLNISEHLELPRVALGANIHLAEIDLLEGRLETAITSLKSLLKEVQQLKLNNFICRIGLLLSRCYTLKNMPNKAVAIERLIKPILNNLEPVWLYERVREFERVYCQLQPIYQTEINEIQKIATQTFIRYHKTSSCKHIIGQSVPMREVCQLIEKIAPTDLPVLIQGETGTGKELVAQAIHQNSLRGEKPWLATNCGAVPETLLENELFGHTAGAFTDAYQEKKGYFELASDGTLFLDEIGDMSLAMQQKLLRVLEEKQVWRLGAEKSIPVNTRFIFASNQNIEELVKTKKFREDLYYRINTIVITLPPLRDRKEDIPLLINHFLNKYSPNQTQDAGRLTPDALALLQDYSWPGNIRELENEIKRICTLNPNINTITEGMISETIRTYNSSLSITSTPTSLQELKDTYECSVIIETLKKYQGNITQTARQLSCPRRHLQRKIKQFKIDPSVYFVT